MNQHRSPSARMAFACGSALVGITLGLLLSSLVRNQNTVIYLRIDVLCAKA